MPPRTRTRVAKALKENYATESKSKQSNKISKPARKALADKTNSLSDNNASIEVPNNIKKVVTKVSVLEEHDRPRRQRRLPPRYIENHVLNKLSNNKGSVLAIAESPKTGQDNNSNENKAQSKQESKTKNFKNGDQKKKRPIKNKITSQASTTSSINTLPKFINTHSPCKPPTDIENSIIANRPKRMHRLPSRFEEHSMSPIKFVPIVPAFASTPLQQKEPKSNINESNKHKKNNNVSNKVSPDTNNNPKKVRAARKKVNFKNLFSPPLVTLKSKSPILKNGRANRLLNKSPSLKVLDKQNKVNQDVIDVYEFTYNPDEEPPPQKKKKKRVVKKNPPKPKFVLFKNNYDQNLSNTLNNLKKMVSKKSKILSDAQNNKTKNKPSTDHVQSNKNFTDQNICNSNNPVIQQNVQQIKISNPAMIGNNEPATNLTSYQQTLITIKKTPKTTASENSHTAARETNPVSIRIEDIAADFESSENHDDINYSPVNSPIRSVTPNPKIVTENVNFHLKKINEPIENGVNNNDPLNLQGVSFFEELPAACSSMNISARHPLASPWRVEFGSLPIKWQVNTYVKPNMTPAVESSFISSKDDSKKKHVYTNIMVPQSNETLPQIVENNTSYLKQTSIISFIKEVAEKNASKKKRALSITPTKSNSLFEDITNGLKKKGSPQKIFRKDDNLVISNKKSSNDKENVRESRKRRNENNIESIPAKSPCRQKDEDCTYFGFDESENQGNKNKSPTKIDLSIRALRPRARAVLQEINGQVGPTRAVLPLAVKSKTITSSEAVNRMYDDMKSAEVAPTFETRNNVQKHSETTTNDPMLAEDIDNGDSNSVHLFEDIELIHHLKPTRKSYGKAKKVTFRQHSVSSVDVENSDVACHSDSSGIDDFGDLTFTMPAISKKKPTRKKKTKGQLSNKEKKEVEAWAAGFNSMCEDIEEFPLIVE